MSPPPIIRDRYAVLIWLMLCIQLIASIVLIGGYTRLSDSGLSITQWNPIYGVIPPLNENQWQEEFASYKSTPQYKKIYSDMSIIGFKAIFWPEYIHRLLGRAIGVVFFLPLLIFAIRKSISRQFFWRMIGILSLGALQGGIGWIMVKSGLEDNPYVNHIKLTLHLSIAFTIFALILWAILDIINYNISDNNSRKHLHRISSSIPKYHVITYKLWFFLLCTQIIFGGFVAGLHAGLVYNTWPTMNGEFIPGDLLIQSSLTMNLFENIVFIQFIHRVLAIIVTTSILFWCYSYREYIMDNDLGLRFVSMLTIIFIQFILGVFTLIYHVPLPLALAHQMNALLLWTIAILLLYKLTHNNNAKKYIKLVK